MNRHVFADAGFWIAVVNPRDSLHDAACSIAVSFRGRRIVTTQMVLVEFLNDLGRRGHRLRTAHDAVEQIMISPDTIVVPQSDRQFRSALSLYGERGDKAWSFTGCASFLAMRDLGISEALTHDRHFEQMGFQALLRS